MAELSAISEILNTAAKRSAILDALQVRVTRAH
jgi:hypothetical protein